VVDYGTRNKQAAPRSKFIAMTRFYDLNVSVKAKTTSYNEIFAYRKESSRPTSMLLVEIDASRWK